MTVNATTDTEKGRTGIAPTYLHTTPRYYKLGYCINSITQLNRSFEHRTADRS